MNIEVYNYLKANPELLMFVRYNPIWYRYLSRDPQEVFRIEKEARMFYGKTFSQRLEKLNENIHLTAMLIEMSQAMKD